ncbi:MAG: hypothetical protein ACREPW_13295 [Candidatus Binataceae bacterium]
MNQIALKVFAAMIFVGVLGTGGYVLTSAGSTADTPACCQSKQACCPSQSCCSGGSHGAQCPMHHRA